MKAMIKELGLIMNDFICCLKDFVTKYFKIIFKILMLGLICINSCYTKSIVKLMVLNLIIILVVDFVLLVYDKAKQKKYYEENKIPTYKRKLTKVNSDGDVEVRKADLNIAVIYLNQVEDYLEKHGHKYLTELIIIICLPCLTVNATELDDDEQVLIQQVAIAEAGNQGIGGMSFVIQTVLNRVESEQFPNDVESVIYQKGQFETATDDLKSIQITNNSTTALELVRSGILLNKGQLYFENTYGSTQTWHSKNLELIFTHLDHSFYK
jgi:N-acetylmuramoyl-L-alanine amidase